MHVNKRVKVIPASITWKNSAGGITLELERVNLSKS